MAKGKEEDIEKQEVSLKELREDLYRLRDFEISNLWQRSIFLSAMIVLLFSGYGSLILNGFLRLNGGNELLMHAICSGISLIGLVFSIIWVMMAKGSKAWFEVYERKIELIEDELNVTAKYSMKIARCKPKSLDSNLFRRSAGTYSVSKLNIFIGHVLMIIWGVAIVIHYDGIIHNDDYSETRIRIFLLCLIPILVILVLTTAIMNRWAKSTALENAKSKECTFYITTDNLKLDKDAPFTKEQLDNEYKDAIYTGCEGKSLDDEDLLDVLLATYNKQKLKGWIEYVHGTTLIKCHLKSNNKDVTMYQYNVDTNKISYIVAS